MSKKQICALAVLFFFINNFVWFEHWIDVQPTHAQGVLPIHYIVIPGIGATASCPAGWSTSVSDTATGGAIAPLTGVTTSSVSPLTGVTTSSVSPLTGVTTSSVVPVTSITTTSIVPVTSLTQTSSTISIRYGIDGSSEFNLGTWTTLNGASKPVTQQNSSQNTQLNLATGAGTTSYTVANGGGTTSYTLATGGSTTSYTLATGGSTTSYTLATGGSATSYTSHYLVCSHPYTGKNYVVLQGWGSVASCPSGWSSEVADTATGNAIAPATSLTTTAVVPATSLTTTAVVPATSLTTTSVSPLTSVSTTSISPLTSVTQSAGNFAFVNNSSSSCFAGSGCAGSMSGWSPQGLGYQGSTTAYDYTAALITGGSTSSYTVANGGSTSSYNLVNGVGTTSYNLVNGVGTTSYNLVNGVGTTSYTMHYSVCSKPLGI